MNIIFANARPALPFFFDGGAERTTFTLVSSLARRGIKIIQISLFPRGRIWLAEAAAQALGLAYVKQKQFCDDGQTLFRTQNDHLVASEGLLKIIAVAASEFEIVCRAVVGSRQPDLLVTWLNQSEFIIRLGDEFDIPTVLRVVGPDGTQGYPRLGSKTVILANSPLTAQLCSAHYHQPVGFLLGVVNHAEYVVASREAKFVTYINPRKEKGIHLFSRVAALLPEIPFLVVRGWSRTDFQNDERQAIEFLESLSNVTLTPPIADMRQVYGVTSLLLLPSRWLESWARVVGEAQVNGIPIIASNRGASPQNVGRGGIILAYDEPQVWATAIKTVYEDAGLRSDLENRARLNVRRFDPETLVEKYEQFFSTVIEGQQAHAACGTDTVEVLRGYKDGRSRLRLELEQIPMRMAFDLSDPAYP